MDELKVYTNDTDSFVAASLDDLVTVYHGHFGVTMADEGEELSDWHEEVGKLSICWRIDDWKDDEILPEGATVRMSEDLMIVTADASAWAQHNGRGFLCSTEF